jgi:hypothetical protein
MIMSEPWNETKRKQMAAALKAEGGERILQILLDAINKCPGPRELVSEGKVLAMRPTAEPFPAQKFINPVLEILLRPEGGFMAAVHAPKPDDVKNHLRHTKEARWAASLLLQTFQLVKSGRKVSINKIIKITAQKVKQWDEAPRSEKQLTKIWEAYRRLWSISGRPPYMLLCI